MGDTTNIFELPTDPTGGGNVANNINIKMTENAANSQNLNNPQLTLDQNTINQIVNGLHQASNTGLTQLPSRDIPMTTNNITQDPNIQPNYIPQPQQKMQDYIQNYEDNDDIVSNYNRQNKIQNSLDELYSEMQTPLLLAILYFLFQMPFLKKQLYHYFPALFFKDGNMNLYGLLFTSALFGITFYYLSNKIINYYGTF